MYVSHSFFCAFVVQYQSIRNSVKQKYGRLSVGESMASSAVKTAIDVAAKVIVCFSQTGRMAAYIAKFRPCVPTLMVTPDLVSARQASALLLGTHTVQVDSLEETEELIEEVGYELIQSGKMKAGDKIVVVAGRKAGMREQLRIVELKDDSEPHGHFIKGAVEGEGLFFSSQFLLSFGKSVRMSAPVVPEE